MEVRAEKPEDIEAVRSVNVAAFGREGEADLVDRLRGATSTLSLVAVEADQIVGHVFFSPVAIAGEYTNDSTNNSTNDLTNGLLILGLAPVAVLPNYQRQGIGSLLIRQGLQACIQSGCKAVVVLGSPKYYSRFGFTPASEKGLKCEYAVPDEAFMVLELKAGALEGCVGTVKYRSEFAALE
ncbi:GNAT family N-acetyltransferase [Phormidesmis sp. 146-33]